ncbi:MAG TPA: DUF11 domain-containing protein [Solirubrobacteraceae bacterium]|nr:DUF11 domain-containing protein [Solirubrobacteraceae bacterium]
MAVLAAFGMWAAGPALAGTTAASILTKTGTDAKTGAIASAANATATAGPGDTLDWVLHYSNDTGGPAKVNITDPMGPNQTFVSKSLRVSPGLSPEWSTNGGGSFVSSEPGSGVNAVGASGSLPNGGLGAVSPFAQAAASTTGASTRGDGFEDIFYGGNVYNLHHHMFPGEQSNGGPLTLIDCHVVATGAECPSYTGGGLYANSTAGSPFSANVADDNFTTMSSNWSAMNQSNGKLYFATTIANTGNYGVGCLDLSNNTSCGFTQLGTGPGAATAAFDGWIDGGANVGSKYYLLDYTGHLDCFDISTASTCGSIAAYTTSFPTFGQMSAGQAVNWAGSPDVFTYMTSSANSNVADISCVNVTTGAVCPGYPVAPAADNGNTLVPVLDSSGATAGVCGEWFATGGVTATRQFACYDTSGNPIATPTVYSNVPAGSGVSPWPNYAGTTVVVGTKMYYVQATGSSAAVGNPMSYQYECFDWATNAACPGFNSPVQNSAWAGGQPTDLRTYTLVTDPYLPGCLAEDGDAGIVQFFDAATGALGCTGMQAQVAVNPPDFYCDGSAHATSWNKIQISGISASQYAGATYTVLDKNGNPVAGYSNVSIPAGQNTVDISGIPMSGNTAQLSVSMTLANPAAGASAKLSLTFKGTSGAEVCFKTTAGPQTCSADQGLDNEGNAITVGDDGVSDGPKGDDSGYAMFFEPANPKLSGCRADLSIDKTVDASKVAPGGQLMYTLVVQNHGPDTATDALVSDPIPAGLSVVSVKPSQGSCTAAGSVDCSLGTVLSGGSAQILVVANVASGAQGSITNCADASAFQNDPDSANNHSCSTIPVVPAPPARPADVRVVKHVNHPVAKAGEVLTYTLNVKNNGPAKAPNVGITDTSAIGMRVLSIKPSQGACSKGVPFSCRLGAIAAGKTAKVTIRAIPRQTGSEVNSVSTTPGCASDGSCPADPNTHNNVSHANTRVRPALRLVKTVNHHVVKAAQTLSYHLKVTNPTSVAVRHVRVCDRLPAGLGYVGATPTAKLSHGSQCWSYKRLGAHKSRTITLHAKVLKGVSGPKTNHATATATGVPAANAKATVRVMRALELVKTVNHHVINAGQRLTYQLKVTNPNSVAVRHVRVCDRLPLGVVYVGSHPKPKLSKGQECWSYTRLAAHRSKTITLHARALKGASGHKTNHATATATGVPTAKAKATVRIKATPKPPTPVTG